MKVMAMGDLDLGDSTIIDLGDEAVEIVALADDEAPTVLLVIDGSGAHEFDADVARRIGEALIARADQAERG